MAQVGVSVINMTRVGVWDGGRNRLVSTVANSDRRRRRNPVQAKSGVLFFVPVIIEGGGIAQVDSSQRNYSADLAAAVGRCSHLSGRVPFWVNRLLVQVTDRMQDGARCVVIRVGKVSIAFIRHQFILSHGQVKWNDLDWGKMLGNQLF